MLPPRDFDPREVAISWQLPHIHAAIEPAASDYLVAGFFFWAWSLGEQPWSGGSPVGLWFQRLLSQYEAQLGSVKRAA